MNALVVKTALLALVLLCTAQAQSTQTNVTEATRIKACGALNDAACRVVKPCTYCRSRWGESKCFAAEQVSTLPADVYPCRYFRTEAAATSCDNQDQAQCKASGTCSWCESAAVGNACYTLEDAKKLPAAIFSCSTTAALNASAGAGSATAGAQPVTQAAASQQPRAAQPGDVSMMSIGGEPQSFSFSGRLNKALGGDDTASP